MQREFILLSLFFSNISIYALYPTNMKIIKKLKFISII